MWTILANVKGTNEVASFLSHLPRVSTLRPSAVWHGRGKQEGDTKILLHVQRAVGTGFLCQSRLQPAPAEAPVCTPALSSSACSRSTGLRRRRDPLEGPPRGLGGNHLFTHPDFWVKQCVRLPPKWLTYHRTGRAGLPDPLHTTRPFQGPVSRPPV